MALVKCYPCGKDIIPATKPIPKPLPGELKNLAKDLSREVLRIQPEQMLLFIVDYLEIRMERRDIVSDIQKMLNQIVDKFTFERLLARRGITKTIMNAAATYIQRFWRGYLGRKEARERLEIRNDQWRLVRSLGLGDDVNWQTLQRSAIIIQHHYKKYREKKLTEMKKSKKYTGNYPLREEYFTKLWTRITPFEAFNAAIKIQRIFKNYLMEKRRVKDYRVQIHIQAKYYLKSLLRRVSLEEANRAALIIQKIYWRNYRLRLFRQFVESVVWLQRFYMENRQARMKELQKKLFSEENEEEDNNESNYN